ncbi:NAD(P)/FAD-dependent oxidoreductase [Cellulomonas edaphi]|uniref:NAD(P)/FAD-dependent oxidoreductase n=1 Tax=Cellulomonas edaphi TaxID=3053468 RepID=A0ABT7S9N9_9CELL|nr:NAD(P)/FAD-dependent oxidoreductase [Cellulomons edaphi]MDM7832332.1 NAD(P)/FAD-dependent oxidoreductase [Cellulomons edaphi]
MDESWDVVVVGGGSAGLSAALMLVRARRRVVVLDGAAPRNRFAPHMHAVLGHDGLPPTELLAKGRAEIESYGGVVVRADVRGARRTDEGFVVDTSAGRVVGRRVLVATGLRDELPDIPGLAEQWGRGVVSCPYCDGYEVRDRRIGVLAAGPGSAARAQLIRQWSSSVVLLTHGTDAADVDERAGLEARGIQVVDAPVVRVLTADGRLVGAELADGTVVDLDVVFAMPRPVPNDEVLRQLGAQRTESAHGAFVAVDEQGLTAVPGMWAAGNVVAPRANVPVAMGAGAGAGGAINYDLVLEDVRVALAATA